MIMGRDRAAWCDLPKDILEIIADRLYTKSDVTRLRSVCKSWRLSLLTFQNSVVFPLKVPFLGPNSHPELPLILTQTTLYHLSPPACSISNSTSRGWLVKLKESPQLGQFHLINPLSPLQIQPLPDSFPKVIHSLQFRVSELARSYTLHFSNSDICNYKVAFSPNPECPSIMIVASGVLWHLKLGRHDSWIVVDDMISLLSYQDVILYQGKFVAIDGFGRTVVIDSSSLKVTEIASLAPEMAGGQKKLVESNGELLLVNTWTHVQNQGFGRTPRTSIKFPFFTVFELKVDQNRWVQIKSLNDQILFLGHDCSFSASARDFFGCKGNCILYNVPYFLVFNLDDGSVSPVDKHPEYASLFCPPSTWHEGSPSQLLSAKSAAKKQKANPRQRRKRVR